MSMESTPGSSQNQQHAGSTEPTPHATKKPLPRGAKLAALCGAIAVCVIVTTGLLSRSSAENTLGKHTEEAAVESVAVVKPSTTDGASEILLPGNTQPFNDTPIYARTNGYLRHWYVDIGTHVKQGQLLAVIETPELDQQLSQARSDLSNAKANEQLAETTAKRWQSLLTRNAVSKQETDQATSDLAAKQATVGSMEANVRRLEQLQSFEKIYAPFDGVITARNTDIGALIDAGASTTPKELFHIASVAKLRVYVAVPEVDITVAQNGSKAMLTLDEYPGEKFIGTVVRNSDSIDPVTRTLNVEVDIDNSSNRIKTGAYVIVHFAVPRQVAAQAGSSFTVPSNTVLFRSEGLRVAVIREGRAELVPIKIGRDYGSTIEVVSGLSKEDQVIVNPSDSLVSGTPVKIATPTAAGPAT